MNGDKYDPIIEQYRNASDIDDKIECIFTMLKMVACNHLGDVDKDLKDIRKKLKRFTWFGIFIVFCALLSNHIDIIDLIKAFIKATG